MSMAKVKNIDNNKFWKGCMVLATIHCWWDCKMVQPFRETEILLQNIDPREMKALNTLKPRHECL
jgi:hypothetical protein